VCLFVSHTTAEPAADLARHRADRGLAHAQRHRPPVRRPAGRAAADEPGVRADELGEHGAEPPGGPRRRRLRPPVRGRRLRLGRGGGGLLRPVE